RPARSQAGHPARFVSNSAANRIRNPFKQCPDRRNEALFNSLLGVETKCAVKWRKKHRAARAHRSGARRGGFLERRGESVGVQRGDCMKNRTPERKEM
ncbi:hypothetical protein, partial [Burkholderia vietnamiensis]|uniref:hypothetical protein n=1 Tax=Burkholderia vietnamiensis TaxID=60552 RepID=UPI001CF1F64C